ETNVTEAIRGGGDEFIRDQAFIEFFRAKRLARFKSTDAFAEGLLKRAADGHDFADGLHLGAESGVGARELFESPLGNLSDDIVDSRFETGGCFARDVVGDFV